MDVTIAAANRGADDKKRRFFRALAAGATVLGMALIGLVASPALAQQQRKPNILVMWGDDIGIHNISAYN